MFKMLKFDLYKIIKSKMLLVVFILSLCLILVYPIATYVINNNSESSVYGNLYSRQWTLFSLLWVFVVPFVSKDFSSNYIKNLCPSYKKADRIYYILSKVIYIILFCLIYALLTLGIEIVFNYIFGAKCMYKGATDYISYTKREFYLRYFSNFLNCIALGSLLLFLCTILKKEYIVLIIVLPYLFLFGSVLYSAINSIVGNDFSIEKYTIVGMNTSIMFIGNEKGYLLPIGLSLGYTGLFTLLSCIVFQKKDY